MKSLLLALLCFPLAVFSQGIPLSERAEISVITLGPDQNELVQAFGHNAIRVMDPAHGIDYAFNYGVFSFDQPNFYLNFARGHNYYHLGISLYPEFRDVYIYYHRFVHEQVLDLTQGQKQQVFDFLQRNAEPANREYLYDYFFNNCATKIRDVFAEVLRGELRFDSSFIKTDYTIRELMNSYLGPLPWGHLGLNIGLGSPIDRKALPHEYMFLPDYIASSLDHFSILRDGQAIPFVKKKIIVFDPSPVAPEKSIIHPWLAFGSLLLLGTALSAWDWRRKKPSIWFDAILLGSVGLIGVVLLLLWTATDHQACARNFNLIWALPTHLIAVTGLLLKKNPAWLKPYFLVTACIDLLLLLTWPLLPQLLDYFLIPVVVLLLVRAVTLFRLQPTAR